jgi:D-alanyl-D-alanine carboxypeptidase
LSDAFNFVAGGNDAAALTVIRDHQPVLGLATGVGASGQPVTPDTPLVLASVSKLITALTIARLVELHQIDLDGPVPWTSMYLAHDPAWDTVTVRELLSHTSGMPIRGASWLNTPGSCAIPLMDAISSPPTGTRGRWTYSNGNYCALGLLIQVVTGQSLQEAADRLVFTPIGVSGPHLSNDGLLPTDGPYREGVARLERLGGAGTWLASTDDIARMLDSITADDQQTLVWPGIIADQYGWGHTGTVDGAKACAWVMEGGRTVVVAIVAGNRPRTGGRLCDAILPALASDLGIWADKPIRSPE